MKNSIQFIAVFILCTVPALLCVGALNWYADPYSINRPPLKDPEQTVWMSKQLRLAKAFYASELKPDAIVIGASTAQLAIDPNHPGWSGRSETRYNLALPGSNMYENLRFYQHARANSKLRQIILGLDFAAFNRHSPLSDDFKEWMMDANKNGEPDSSFLFKKATALFSLDALTASQKKIFAKGKATHWTNGREIPEEIGERNWRQAMLGSASGFVTRLLLPPPSHQFCLEGLSGEDSPFDQLEMILQSSAADETELYLFIQPSHAFLLEAIHISGYWKEYENWERKLVALVEKINARYSNGKKIALWDFSGYNSFTGESLANENTIPMKWHWDAGHYKKELGDRALDRIFGYRHPDRLKLEKFGSRIDSGNIEKHLQRINSQREEYLKANEQDIRELKAGISSAMKSMPASNCKA